MRYYLGKLLQVLEEAYPDPLTVIELREKISPDIDGTIHDAVRGDLIVYPNYKPDGGYLGTEERIYLGVNGFGLLNQIKMKEAVDQLDKSIKKFNESSDKSSGRLERYTAMLIVLTIILMALTIVMILIPSDFPLWVRAIIIFLAIVMVVIAFPLKKDH